MSASSCSAASGACISQHRVRIAFVEGERNAVRCFSNPSVGARALEQDPRVETIAILRGWDYGKVSEHKVTLADRTHDVGFGRDVQLLDLDLDDLVDECFCLIDQVQNVCPRHCQLCSLPGVAHTPDTKPAQEPQQEAVVQCFRRLHRRCHVARRADALVDGDSPIDTASGFDGRCRTSSGGHMRGRELSHQTRAEGSEAPLLLRELVQLGAPLRDLLDRRLGAIGEENRDEVAKQLSRLDHTFANDLNGGRPIFARDEPRDENRVHRTSEGHGQHLHLGHDPENVADGVAVEVQVPDDFAHAVVVAQHEHRVLLHALHEIVGDAADLNSGAQAELQPATAVPRPGSREMSRGSVEALLGQNCSSCLCAQDVDHDDRKHADHGDPRSRSFRGTFEARDYLFEASHYRLL